MKLAFFLNQVRQNIEYQHGIFDPLCGRICAANGWEINQYIGVQYTVLKPNYTNLCGSGKRLKQVHFY